MRATQKAFEAACNQFGIDIGPTKRSKAGFLNDYEALQFWRMWYAGWRAAKAHTKKRGPCSLCRGKGAIILGDFPSQNAVDCPRCDATGKYRKRRA